jgi:hypothetical protein
LSPRERRIVSALLAMPPNQWATTQGLCVSEFDSAYNKDWPLNARHIVSGALNSLQRKLEYHRSRVALVKRGNGGRAGIEYKLSTSKENSK